MSDDQGSERRIFRRTELASPVEIEIDPDDDRDPSLATGEIVNVGVRGILARLDRPIGEGTLCTVRFLDPEDESETVEARGFVRRSRTDDDGALVGIEFEARMEAVRTPTEERATLEDATTVLVVDDEPSVVDVLYRFLSRRGCDVTTATSGEAALEALREARQDMMLLDLKMPGLGGLEVLERIRDEKLDVGRIWVISGYATDTEAREALRLGAADFINKPLDLKYLQWSMQLYRAAL